MSFATFYSSLFYFFLVREATASVIKEIRRKMQAMSCLHVIHYNNISQNIKKGISEHFADLGMEDYYHNFIPIFILT
jgi:hypothetical protein